MVWADKHVTSSPAGWSKPCQTSLAKLLIECLNLKK